MTIKESFEPLDDFISDSAHESQINYLLNNINESNFREYMDNIFSKVTKIKDKQNIFDRLIGRFNSPKNTINKRYIAMVLIVLYAGFHKYENVKRFEDQLKRATTEISDRSHITYKDIENVVPFTKHYSIFNMNKDLVESLNKINPQRFSEDSIKQYNRYDKDIVNAYEHLRSKGEDPDMDLIKTVMLIETGMRPRKNKKGYEGFPQTKQHIIDEVNKRYKLNLSVKDMYRPKEAAIFIHYFMKALRKSKHVNNDTDAFMAYNWGAKNLGRYKLKKIGLNKETADYVKLFKTIRSHIKNS